VNGVELPLLNLFSRLRELGLPLGVDEYMLVLRALRAGFGVGDHRTLERLCCTLWTKSDDQARLLHNLFRELVAQPAAASHESVLLKPPPSKAPQSAPSPPLLRGPDALKGRGKLESTIQTVSWPPHDDWGVEHSRFIPPTEYFPVTRRQMRQIWRHLRRPVCEGLPEEIDVAATLKEVERSGILLEPVLAPRRSNRAELVLLIDQDGSMVPFHALSRQLVDCPDLYLYRDPARLEALTIPEALATIGERASVLIISDAGAARGYFDSERVERTHEFIQQMRFVRYCVWLNPMPETRWPHTTAGEIARRIPMFEMSYRGLDAAISVLRGQVYLERTVL
jgi:hypothetical protein